MHANSNTVMFVSAVPDFKGGAETCLKQFLHNPNITPHLIVPKLGPLSDYAKQHAIAFDVVDFGRVNDVRRPFKLSSIFYACIDALKSGLKIKSLAKKHKAKCIHSNGLKTHGMLAIANIINPFNRTPVICHIHDIPYTTKEMLFWRFLSLTCSKLILVSRHCWGGNNLPTNATIIPNGMALTQKTLENKTLNETLSIGFVGRIHPHKGLDLAIQWLIKAKKQGYKFQFYIRGEAAESEKAYEQSIKDLIAENDLSEICHFEGRIEGYQKVYSNLDITLMPSVQAEPFGLVAIESFDNGVICFAYPSGALPSIIKHQESGYLCQTADDFVSSLKHLTSNKHTYNDMRQNAHLRLKNQYTIETLYHSLNSVYKF
ncbi:glycosyltransferase family 4 protein [Marinicellulosiphila megalodicopiae]|uniref:glycosyltransferase family 4 protein n=1 Tax=Marinicellulosiphila megalodicopiae TaxID=2724896 RepID=UPI003BAF8875